MAFSWFLSKRGCPVYEPLKKRIWYEHPFHQAPGRHHQTDNREDGGSRLRPVTIPCAGTNARNDIISIGRLAIEEAHRWQIERPCGKFYPPLMLHSRLVDVQRVRTKFSSVTVDSLISSRVAQRIVIYHLGVYRSCRKGKGRQVEEAQMPPEVCW